MENNKLECNKYQMGKKFMKSHRKIYEDFHGIKIPKYMDIHHIDGNHSNNDPLNLKLVTIRDNIKKDLSMTT